MGKRTEPGKKKRKEGRRTIHPSGHLIVTEGVKTEVNYFNGFKEEINQKYANTVESYEINIRGAGKETLRIIEEINDIRRRSPHVFEHVWAVFDKDDFPKDHFDNAITAAYAHNIKVAWSNECIELWFLLHFSYLSASIPRELYYEKLNDALRKIGVSKGYSKIDSNLYHILKPYQPIAIQNAGRLKKNYQDHISYSNRLPCTTVDELVSELQNIIDQ